MENQPMSRLGVAILIAVLTVSFTAAQNQPPSSAVMQYVQEGSQAYVLGDYKKAIAAYSKALEMEKEKPELNKTLWYVLVDNLGIAYGITGDLKKAKETFDYGLTKDPKYPMFHYNLACTYAEMDDLDNAIASLKRAFETRFNMLPGERLPDASTDSSFKRYMNNERFLSALREMK
jgi:tetratricopeptide (TPR) repeat protein